MHLNGYEIAAIVCILLGIVIFVIGALIDHFLCAFPKFMYGTAICFFLAIILYRFGTRQEKNEMISVIEEHYQDCMFVDDNTFCWDDKMYEYELNKNRDQVVIKYQENGTKKMLTYELEK